MCVVFTSLCPKGKVCDSLSSSHFPLMSLASPCQYQWLDVTSHMNVVSNNCSMVLLMYTFISLVWLMQGYFLRIILVPSVNTFTV